MKKILVFGLTCAFAQMVNAAYLYWQVSSSDITGASDAIAAYEDGTYKTTDINAARIYLNGTAQDVYLNGSQVTTVSEKAVSVPLGSMYSVNVADLDSLAEYSYYVELGNYANSQFTAIARSSVATGALLYSSTDSTSIIAELADVTRVTPWHASSYTAVPEPTSAILMLFGAAFLGLKRKNRSLA